MRILFAEDEVGLREVVTAYMEFQGYHVTAVDNGYKAVEEATKEAFDIIVMDVMMPKMDGITAMKKIRELGNNAPAIFLTAKSQVSDRVEGLDAGADDYLTKPFALEELNARLRALNRRRREYKIHTVVFSNLELDTEQFELRAHNTISLTYKEVQLFSYLISKAGESITTKELMEEIWPGEQVQPELVWLYVSFLRGKLQAVRANVTIDGDQKLPFRLREINNVQ